MKPLLTLPLLFVPLAIAGWAQKATQAPAGLEAGLEAIQPKSIEKDLYFLASDEMGGRDTPSPEQRKAARFIEARLKQLGFQPGFQDSYLWTYHRSSWRVVEEGSTATLHMGDKDVSLQLGEDYFIRTHYLDPEVHSKVDVVYLGDSRDAADVKAKYEGAYVLLDGQRRPSRKTLQTMIDQGAIGFFVMPPKRSDTPVAEAEDRNHRRMTQLRGGDGPRDTRPAVNLLTESAAEHFAPLIKGKKAGAKLPLQISSQCQIEVVPSEDLENVIGIWPGSDPVLRNEVIILSAHYDHVGKREDGTIFNGADDNASGTSGLLALSEALKAYGPMRRTIMLQWVSGEEKGLWGSAAWTQDPWFPEGMKAVCNINIDMIGRNAGDELLITPTKKHAEYSWLTKVAEEHRAKEGFKKLKSADDYYQRSDHYNYRKHLNVPVIFLFADVHEDYHRPTDTPDKINYDKVTRVARLVLRILDGLQTDKLER